jgi:hypothetical protein
VYPRKAGDGQWVHEPPFLRAVATRHDKLAVRHHTVLVIASINE